MAQSVHHGWNHLNNLIAMHKEAWSIDERKIQYIRDYLQRNRIRHWVDRYRSGVNVYAFLEGEDNQNTLAFMAHHDVVHPEYHNAQDNTASVSNLLHLLTILKFEDLPRNVLVCFTDEEENGGGGSSRVARMMKKGIFPLDTIDCVVNLELTGKGKVLWSDFADRDADFLFDDNAPIKDSFQHKFMTNHPDHIQAQTPFSDAHNLRRKGINAHTIGIIDDENHEAYKKTGFPPVWGVCHQKDDSVEKCSAEDMTEFVEKILKGLI